MTAVEAYELTTRGRGDGLCPADRACESFGPYCLIGGLAVNCYVELVYTLDADLVVISSNLAALAPGSQLRILFTTDESSWDERWRLKSWVSGSESRAWRMLRAGNSGLTAIHDAA